MHFESLAAFFSMGGYAFYVWLSYGISLLLIAGITFVSVRRRQQLINQIRAKQIRDQKLKNYREGKKHNES